MRRPLMSRSIVEHQQEADFLRTLAAELAHRPADILSAWTAIEVLSPAQFDKPEDVAGQRSAVADLGPELPWRRGEKSQPKKRMYYQVVLGAIGLPAAFEALAAVFADSRPERPRTRAYAPLAVLTLDKEGRPVEDGAASVASFGWGMPVALADGVARLADWRHAEADLANRLDERVRVLDAAGKVKPLDQAMIDKAFTWIIATLGLERKLVRPPLARPDTPKRSGRQRDLHPARERRDVSSPRGTRDSSRAWATGRADWTWMERRYWERPARSSIHSRMMSAIWRLFLSCISMWLLPWMPSSDVGMISTRPLAALIRAA